MIFFDTETCGLHSMCVLIQFYRHVPGTKFDKSKIILHEIWNEPIVETLSLIEEFCMDPGGVVGFNLTFDWFHLCKTYCVLQLLGKKVGFDKLPINYINDYANLEAEARDGPCLKPQTSCDLMLHARKGPYQSTMDRKDIRIKRVPAVLANPLANELENRIKLKDIYFARKKDKLAKHWQVYPIRMADGQYNPDFRDVILKFAASAALKTLAADALELPPDEILLFSDVDVDRKYRPLEMGWAPFSTAVSSEKQKWEVSKTKAASLSGTKGKGLKKRGYAAPAVVIHHIRHWQFNELARRYAAKDVELTYMLWEFFGCPESGDNDSILACQVAAVRWRGFKVDLDGIKKLRQEAIIKAEKAPKAPRFVFKYIAEVMDPMERDVLRESTKRVVLEKIETWTIDCKCGAETDNCGGAIPSEFVKFEKRDDPTTCYCSLCNSHEIRHPAAIRASECTQARRAAKEREIYDKLLQAGRFHVSNKIIGTLSSRMSGTDGLNPQGIKHDKYVRKCFPLALEGMELCGGDFSGFEISIAEAIYNDKALREQLLTCSKCLHVMTPDDFRGESCPKCGSNNDKFLRKIHGLFAMALNPGLSYDDILKTKGTAVDLYDQGKRGVFSQLYGGNFQTLMNKLKVSEEVAVKAEKKFADDYPGVGIAREEIDRLFCSMKQPGGLGSKVIWNDPAEYCESLTGFKRYFTLENMICKSLFTLANKPPQGWKEMKIRVVRDTKAGREQKAGGAVMSALYGAAFGIQSASMRAAANHIIQSTGATICKELQVRLWGLQPAGINGWLISPMNVHDEIMAPCVPKMKPFIKKIVDGVIEDYKSLIPLIKIDWSNEMNVWADK